MSATQEFIDKMLTNIKDHDTREKTKMFRLGTIISQGGFLCLLNRKAIGWICTPASRTTTYVYIEYTVIYFLFWQGHSRQGTCLCHLKRKKEALEAFCKAHTCALNEKEENATANDVISTAMDVEGWWSVLNRYQKNNTSGCLLDNDAMAPVHAPWNTFGCRLT